MRVKNFFFGIDKKASLHYVSLTNIMQRISRNSRKKRIIMILRKNMKRIRILATQLPPLTKSIKEVTVAQFLVP